MANDLDFYRHLATTLTDCAVVVATVIRTNGSVPREVGAKLLWAEDGTVRGTIGGGAGEAKVLQAARTVLSTGENQQINLDLSGLPQRQIQGICGGQMQVWLERWWGEAAIALSQQIIQSLERGQAVRLVHPLTPNQVPYLQQIEPAQPTPTHPATFIEILQPPPTLLIVGAGHCGIELAKVGYQLGFQVMVQDDRVAWANPQNFPQATQLFTRSMASVVEDLAAHSQLYVALVTRGFDYDLAALRALLQRSIPCAYIGMIGSQQRVKRVVQAIRAAGFSGPCLCSLHAPIGLDIGALTPAEIAVSIGAELVLVRRGGTGQPLSASCSWVD